MLVHNISKKKKRFKPIKTIQYDVEIFFYLSFVIEQFVFIFEIVKMYW